MRTLLGEYWPKVQSTDQVQQSLYRKDIWPIFSQYGWLPVWPFTPSCAGSKSAADFCFRIARLHKLTAELRLRNKMAAQIDLAGARGLTERDDRFWNRFLVIMKTTVEPQWLKTVNTAKRKPVYGMRDLDEIMEERMGNKIELVGPMVDAYIKQIGHMIGNKLSRSRNTGLMSPISIFVPWSIFRHIFVLVVGYGGDIKSSEKKIVLTISSYNTAKKVFSPVRMLGKNCLKKRCYKYVKQNGKRVSKLTGRASVVVTEKSPIQLSYNRNQEIAVVSLYIQRYDENDFAVDLSLQKRIS